MQQDNYFTKEKRKANREKLKKEADSLRKRVGPGGRIIK